jgi:hypothetical protein
MKNDTQYKMLNYEVPPPEKAWYNIAAALDESISYNKIAAKLLTAEELPAENNWAKIEAALFNSISDRQTAEKLLNSQVLPPAQVWLKIKEELEVIDRDKGIKEKLFDVEQVPAGNIWAKLEKQLDEEQWDTAIGKKIVNTEVYPPAGTWNNIKAELNGDASAPAKVIQFGSWKKIAVAAALIGVIATGVVMMFTTTPPKNDTNSTAVVEGKKDNNTIVPLPKEIEAPEVKAIDRNTLAAAVEKKTVSPVDPKTTAVPVKKKFNNKLEEASNETVAAAFISTEPTDDTRSKPEDTKSRIHKAIRNVNTDESIAMIDQKRYYNLLDENGNIVRISRKLNAMECIIKTGLDIPFDKKEEDKECNDKVKDWHDKMALSTSVLSPLDLPAVLSANK